MSWGWTLKPAGVGSASGTFLNPAPTCPPATCAGIGTGTVTWGIGEQGMLSFAGASHSPKTGDAFKLGTLTYHNGATLADSAIGAVDLDIALHFDNVSELDFTHHTTLGITNTPNTSDPVASADFVSFTQGGFSASFNVLEGQTASVDLMAVLTPTLQLTPNALPGSYDRDKLETASPTWICGATRSSWSASRSDGRRLRHRRAGAVDGDADRRWLAGVTAGAAQA